MQYAYITALLVAFSGILLADHRLRLVMFRNARLSLALITASVCFFLIWDILGVALGVFATNQEWVSGLYIGTPNLPIEEFIFLAFLSYVTLVAWRLVCLRTS